MDELQKRVRFGVLGTVFGPSEKGDRGVYQDLMRMGAVTVEDIDYYKLSRVQPPNFLWFMLLSAFSRRKAEEYLASRANQLDMYAIAGAIAAFKKRAEADHCIPVLVGFSLGGTLAARFGNDMQMSSVVFYPLIPELVPSLEEQGVVPDMEHGYVKLNDAAEMLIVVGQNDHGLPEGSLEHIRNLEQYNPHVRVKAIPGVGHAFNLTHVQSIPNKKFYNKVVAKEVWNGVTRWLNGHSFEPVG